MNAHSQTDSACGGIRSWVMTARRVVLLLVVLTGPAAGQGGPAVAGTVPRVQAGVRVHSEMGINSADPDLPAARIDAAVRLASEDPQRALAALDALAVQWDLPPPAEQGLPSELGLAARDAPELATLLRLLSRARLQVLVDARDAAALAAALAGAPPQAAPASPEAADHALMQAQLAELENRPRDAAERASAALTFYRASCPLPAALRAGVEAAGGRDAPGANDLRSSPHCDYRAIWQAERILERQAMTSGVQAQARASAEMRLALALAAGDAHRAAQTWSLLAYLAALAAEPATEVDRLLGQARAYAEQAGDSELRIRILVNESAVASLQGDARTGVARIRSALALARSAGLQRLQPMLLTNLADAQLRLRQPRQALRTVEEALPLAERLGEVRVLHALRNNAGLAQIGLGQIEAGKREMERSEALLGSEGNSGQRVAMLREFGEALAAAGDARGALDLYHRERALAAQISRENLEAALREIQASFDAEVRQRDMALLQDQVATRNEELASQDLTLRIWLLLLALLGVLLLLGGVLYGRLRGRERLLSERRERLRRESEQDPLTGLGNRRAFEARMQALPPDAPPGALLLLDVDHFKRINDRHGHAAGDVVLVEVARRILACLRREDLVVRWGGEEFLVHVAGMDSTRALGLARRILERIAADPVETANGSLQVTASLGLCMDRLPSCPVALNWEERLRLADLALYAAKSRGRGRAVGVLDSAADGDTLRAPEIDFEAAERSGRLRVQSVVVTT